MDGAVQKLFSTTLADLFMFRCSQSFVKMMNHEYRDMNNRVISSVWVIRPPCTHS